jgi:hypothetical protein
VAEAHRSPDDSLLNDPFDVPTREGRSRSEQLGAGIAN